MYACTQNWNPGNILFTWPFAIRINSIRLEITDNASNQFSSIALFQEEMEYSIGCFKGKWMVDCVQKEHLKC